MADNGFNLTPPLTKLHITKSVADPMVASHALQLPYFSSQFRMALGVLMINEKLGIRDWQTVAQV